MNIPNDLRYTHDHEWAQAEGKFCTIGITNYAQDQLSDIVFVEMPTIGVKFSVGDVFGTIEAVKTVAELLMPVGGEIIEINKLLKESPEILNSDPYGDGWIIKIKMDNLSEYRAMLTLEAYRELVG